MRSLKVKKLAAAATAVASSVGMVAAPVFAWQRSDFYNPDGTPKVTIVVGQNAAASDFLAAGNIAAAIAANAYVEKNVPVAAKGVCKIEDIKTADGKYLIKNGVAYVIKKEVATGGQCSVEKGEPQIRNVVATLSIGSTTVKKSGEIKEIKEVMDGEKVGATLSSSNYPVLKKVTFTQKYKGSDVDYTVQEYIDVNIKPDVYVNNANDGDDSRKDGIFATIENIGDIKYRVAISKAVPDDYKYEDDKNELKIIFLVIM